MTYASTVLADSPDVFFPLKETITSSNHRIRLTYNVGNIGGGYLNTQGPITVDGLTVTFTGYSSQGLDGYSFALLDPAIESTSSQPELAGSGSDGLAGGYFNNSSYSSGSVSWKTCATHNGAVTTQNSLTGAYTGDVVWSLSFTKTATKTYTVTVTKGGTAYATWTGCTAPDTAIMGFFSRTGGVSGQNDVYNVSFSGTPAAGYDWDPAHWNPTYQGSNRVPVILYTGMTMTDSSGHAHNGTYYNSCGLNANGAKNPNNANSTAQFETLSDNQGYGQTTWQAPTYTTWSLEYWLNPNLDSGSGGRALSTSHTDSDHNGFQLAANGSSAKHTLTLGNGSTAVAMQPTGSYANPGFALHIVWTYDGTTVKYYENGSLVTSWTTFTGSITTATYGFAVGRGSYGNDYWKGHISDVAMYPTTLSATQISTHYTAGTTPGATTYNASPSLSAKASLGATTLNRSPNLAATATAGGNVIESVEVAGNDLIANAMPMKGHQQFSGSIVGYSTETGEQAYDNSGPISTSQKTAWFSFVTSSNYGRYPNSLVTTSGSDIDTLLSQWTPTTANTMVSTPNGTLTWNQGNDDSSVSGPPAYYTPQNPTDSSLLFSAAPSTVTYFRVEGKNGAAGRYLLYISDTADASVPSGATNYPRGANLKATATLSPTVTKATTPHLTASMSAKASFGVTVVRTKSTSAALSATATLSGTLTRVKLRSAAMAASATLSSSTLITRHGSAALTSTATFAATASKNSGKVITPALTSTATLSSATTHGQFLSSALSMNSALTLTTLRTLYRSASLSSTATLASPVTKVLNHFASASMNAVASVGVTARDISSYNSAALNSLATLSGSALRTTTDYTSPALSAKASFAAGLSQLHLTPSLTMTALLNAAGTDIPPGDPTVPTDFTAAALLLRFQLQVTIDNTTTGGSGGNAPQTLDGNAVALGEPIGISVNISARLVRLPSPEAPLGIDTIQLNWGGDYFSDNDANAAPWARRRTIPVVTLDLPVPFIVGGKPMLPAWSARFDSSLRITGHEFIPDPDPDKSTPATSDFAGHYRWSVNDLPDPRDYANGYYWLGTPSANDGTQGIEAAAQQWAGNDKSTAATPVWQSVFPFKPSVWPHTWYGVGGNQLTITKAVRFNTQFCEHMWAELGGVAAVPMTMVVVGLIQHFDTDRHVNPIIDTGKAPSASGISWSAAQCAGNAQLSADPTDRAAMFVSHTKMATFTSPTQNANTIYTPYTHDYKPRMYASVINGADSFSGSLSPRGKFLKKGTMHDPGTALQHLVLGRRNGLLGRAHTAHFVCFEIRMWGRALSRDELSAQYDQLSSTWKFHQYY